MTTQIFPLSEGTFTIGHDKIFQPFNENKDELNDRPTGSLLVEVQPFAVVNDRDVILLDTGLGFNNPDGQAHLPGNLAAHNIYPEDVTKVLLSHLHKDHAGGLDLSLFFQCYLLCVPEGNGVCAAGRISLLLYRRPAAFVAQR